MIAKNDRPRCCFGIVNPLMRCRKLGIYVSTFKGNKVVGQTGEPMAWCALHFPKDFKYPHGLKPLK